MPFWWNGNRKIHNALGLYALAIPADSSNDGSQRKKKKSNQTPRPTNINNSSLFQEPPSSQTISSWSDRNTL
jgi:hypothetical protein